MSNLIINNQILPSDINVVEKYTYQARVSGVHQIQMEQEPSGLIEVTIPYNKHKHFDQPALANQEQWSATALALKLLAARIGHLHIDLHGHSNINATLDPNADEDLLPIRIDIDSRQLEAANIHKTSHFDLCLKHAYQPDEPDVIPIKIITHVKDEDYIEPYQSRLNQPVREELMKEIDSLKRSLTIIFRVEIVLPQHLGSRDETDPLQIAQMTLSWPIATPPHLASLRVGNTPYTSLIYNPEGGHIEWVNIPLKAKNIARQRYTLFTSEKLYLEISEPTEIYQMLELAGRATIELNGLFSELGLRYVDDTNGVHDQLPKITYRTILAVNFTLNLGEGLELKYYSPRQHLHFPGVVLDDMRVADITMLLKDKGFELKTAAWQQQGFSNNSTTTEKVEKRFYRIEATRTEGARELTLFLLMQGVDSKTTREKRVLGKAKYTTGLSTGATTIYIRGQLQGDNKRVVNVINEIQKQLKEQFRHAGAVE